MKLKSANKQEGRLVKLKALAAVLAEEIDAREELKALPQLAKQYRDTIREIEEIEGTADTDDEIGEILTGRAADGKPGAVRKNRA